MFCLNCGKEFFLKKRKCCCEQCGLQWRKKKSKEWKKNNSERLKEWRKKNKDKMRKYMREYMANYFKDEEKRKKHYKAMKQYRKSKKNV